MPIWNPQCGGSDHAEVNQTYIHHITETMAFILPALEAPCDDWGTVLSGLLGTVHKRLESQAGVHGRRVKAVAAGLDALGIPEGLPPVDDGSASPPLIQLETAGDVTGPTAIMAVQEAPEDEAAPRHYQDPKEPEDVFAFRFAERRAPWHQQAVAWAGPWLAEWLAYPSLAAAIAARTDGPAAGGAPDPSHPDIP